MSITNLPWQVCLPKAERECQVRNVKSCNILTEEKCTENYITQGPIRLKLFALNDSFLNFASQFETLTEFATFHWIYAYCANWFIWTMQLSVSYHQISLEYVSISKKKFLLDCRRLSNSARPLLRSSAPLRRSRSVSLSRMTSAPPSTRPRSTASARLSPGRSARLSTIASARRYHHATSLYFC